MKHKIRFRTHIKTDIREFDCELGSGIKDKTGREIFEGDILTDDTDKTFYKVLPRYAVFFRRGEFILIREDSWKCWEVAGGDPPCYWTPSYLKVIGHME